MLWNREPVLVQKELRSLVACRKHLLEMLVRLAWQGVKPRPGPSSNDYSVCCLLYVLFVTHLRSDARQVCTSLVNSATVPFVC